MTLAFPPPAPAAPEVHAVLDAVSHHAPHFEAGLSNHLPMALHALCRLGASAAQCDAFRAAYEGQLVARGLPMADALWPGWAQALGQRGAFETLRAHFAHALATQGEAAVLADAVPVLMPGAGGDAFHGLIRLGHALDAGHAEEQAQALAYWACSALPLRSPGAAWPVGSQTPQAWLQAVLALPRPVHPDLEKPRIALRMRAWSHAEGFDATATALAVGSTKADAQALVEALAGLAAVLYAHTRNFTVLHVITSLWALRSLLPCVPDAATAVRDYAVALAAGLRAARLTARDALALTQPLPAPLAWPVLREAACLSLDDHAAKFLWVCEQWAQVSGQAVFQVAASEQYRLRAEAAASP